MSAVTLALEEGFDLLQIMPCDTPLVDEEIIEQISMAIAGVDCVVPESSSGLHPLHALVRIIPFRKALSSVGGGIHQVIRSMNHGIIKVEDDSMVNLNTEEDLERFIPHLDRHRQERR